MARYLPGFENVKVVGRLVQNVDSFVVGNFASFSKLTFVDDLGHAGSGDSVAQALRRCYTATEDVLLNALWLSACEYIPGGRGPT